MSTKLKLMLLVLLGVIMTFSSPVLATLADLSNAMSDLMDHIDGTTPLTGPQIETRTATIEANKAYMDDNTTIMGEAFALVDYYDTIVGPLWINAETNGGFPRVQGGSDGYELERAIFAVQQAIIDVIYTRANCQTYQAFLNGKILETSDFFPGACTPPVDPEVSYAVAINASNPTMWGKPVMYGPKPARRPTGLYLAPGSIGEVTVPSAMVNQGFTILVGAHAVDKYEYYKTSLLRLDRVSKSFSITSTVTRIGNPLGGGVYIMVPYEADLGTRTVEIKNVVQSPYFAATSINQTTLQEWTDTERYHPGPWADFESEKFMMTLPTSWIYNYADPVSQMQDWDLAMDGVSELLGYIPPYNVRNLAVLYLEPDLSIQHGAYGTGYPQINTIYDPDAPTNGNSTKFFLTDVLGSSTEYHELSHSQLFSKYPGHTEATVNLQYVYVAHEKFGVPLVDAFTGSTHQAYMENVDVDQAALTWFVRENFRNGNPMDISNSSTNEVRYQHRGYGREVDIGELFGWDVISDFYYQEHLDYMDPPPGDGLGEVDSRIFRFSKAAGVDLTPLVHCWGVHPVDPDALRAAIEDAELPSSQVIYDRLVHYKDIIPANNDEFWDHYLTVYPSQPTGGDPDYGYGWYNVWKSIYNETHGTAAKAAMQDIIDLYFPAPPAPTFVAAGAVTSGTGTISPALPTGRAVNDILLLFVETANQSVSITNQNGGTWALVSGSPQFTGTAGSTAATRLTVFWSRYNGTQGNPTVSDSGDHQLARMVAIRGAVTSGNPWNVTAGNAETTSDTSVSIPGATTTVANTLVVVATAGNLPDASGTTQFSAWTNANLTSLTERTDNSVTAGNGGSLGIATGIKATAGAYGNTAATRANSATKGNISIAIKP